MSRFVTVSRVSDFRPAVARAFEVEGRPIAIAHVDGKWYAFDDTCTHASCSLAEGEVEDTSIICPCHDGEFDMATGEVLGGPPPRPIQTYDVRVDDGEVKVALGRPE